MTLFCRPCLILHGPFYEQIKYLELKIELTREWNCRKVCIIPIAIRAFQTDLLLLGHYRFHPKGFISAVYKVTTVIFANSNISKDCSIFYRITIEPMLVPLVCVCIVSDLCMYVCVICVTCSYLAFTIVVLLTYALG